MICTVVADSPTRVPDQDRIVAKARFRCEPRGADVLTVAIRLEKQDGEQWRGVASRTFTMRGDETEARPLKYQSREVTIGCAEGNFRTVVDWKRTSSRNTKGDNLVSGTLRDPCKPLLPLR